MTTSTPRQHDLMTAASSSRFSAELSLDDEDVIRKVMEWIDLRPLVASSGRKNIAWRFTTDAPAGDDAWTALEYDDSTWRNGEGPFGFSNPVRTSWTSSDIWLRHEFELENAVEASLVFLARIDDEAEFYVNGVRAGQRGLPRLSRYNYPQRIDGTEAARQALRPGKNVLAVHCHNVGGPSIIDVGLYAAEYGNDALEFLSRLVATGSESILVGELLSRMYAEAGDWKGAFADQKRLRAAEAGTGWEPSRVKELLPPGSSWRYFDRGVVADPSWRQPDFDDGAWKEGGAPLGYGDAAVLETEVGFGPDPSNKHPTTYFRRTFIVDSTDRFSALRVYLRRDDAAAVYINGAEVVRDGLPDTADHETFSQHTVTDEEEVRYVLFEVAPDVLRAGENVVAVEVHQVNATSSDLCFDLVLEGLVGED